MEGRRKEEVGEGRKRGKKEKVERKEARRGEAMRGMKL